MSVATWNTPGNNFAFSPSETPLSRLRLGGSAAGGRTVEVTMVTRPREESELRGLVWSLTPRADFHDENEGELAWWQQPNKLAGVSLVMVIILNIVFW